jgi:hypothetical protein
MSLLAYILPQRASLRVIAEGVVLEGNTSCRSSSEVPVSAAAKGYSDWGNIGNMGVRK